MNEWYTNYLPHLFGFIVILLLCLPSLVLKKWTGKFDAHQALVAEDVTRALVWQAVEEERTYTAIPETRLSSLIQMHNKSTFIQKRERYTRFETTFGIRIELKTGDFVEITQAAQNIDIYRTRPKKPNILYWASGEFDAFVAAVGRGTTAELTKESEA